MNKCLAALTANQVDSPPFINASLTPEGKVAVIVRGEAVRVEDKSYPVAPIAEMVMSRTGFVTWAREALDTLDKA